MVYKYKATTPEGLVKDGTLEASSLEIAISALQKRNLIIVSLEETGKPKFFLKKNLFSFFETVKKRDVVILSRKISTLFEAKVPVLRSLRLLATEAEKPVMKKVLDELISDIEGGSKISQAMSRHPSVFSSFYVSMVRAGEESGKLDEVFIYLADYLERSHDLASKAIRALVYPAFIMSAFIAVMVLMLVVVVPKLADIVEESGQEAPVYTKIIISVSDIMRSYSVFVLVLLVLAIVFLWRYSRTKTGRLFVDRFQLSAPFIGILYKKLFLSRIADSLQTLIVGGVTMVRSLEITSQVIDNSIYKAILLEALEAVKGGSNMSEIFARYKEITPLVTQMMKIGEETGKLDFVLKTVAHYYKNEVDQTLEMFVTLIEPIMIVFLGFGVAILLAGVLMPIYNIALTI